MYKKIPKNARSKSLIINIQALFYVGRYFVMSFRNDHQMTNAHEFCNKRLLNKAPISCVKYQQKDLLST